MTTNQEKALQVLKAAFAHGAKTGNREMQWLAAGSVSIHPSAFLALVRMGLAEKRYARGDALRKYDYRLVV